MKLKKVSNDYFSDAAFGDMNKNAERHGSLTPLN